MYLSGVSVSKVRQTSEQNYAKHLNENTPNTWTKVSQIHEQVPSDIKKNRGRCALALPPPKTLRFSSIFNYIFHVSNRQERHGLTLIQCHPNTRTAESNKKGFRVNDPSIIHSKANTLNKPENSQP